MIRFHNFIAIYENILRTKSSRPFVVCRREIEDERRKEKKASAKWGGEQKINLSAHLRAWTEWIMKFNKANMNTFTFYEGRKE
jgi:hypothetical protein